LSPDLDDSQLARLFYPKADTRTSTRYQVPDWPIVHQELKGKGVTKQLVWEEYTERYPNRCYSYSQFCDRYLHWRKRQKRSMRQTHMLSRTLSRKPRTDLSRIVSYRTSRENGRYRYIVWCTAARGVQQRLGGRCGIGQTERWLRTKGESGPPR